jgi:2-dehydro-3-deoxygalactonokinase
MFISCDWGTSSFRLRLVDQESHSVLAEVKSDQGIARMNQLWQEQARDESGRLLFYQSIVAGQVRKLQEQVSYALWGLPIVISGMASANIGMIELPYKMLPFAVNGNDLVYKKIGATDSFAHETIIISGARTAHDVMRGEEIQLIGCTIQSGEQHVYILPGTHSKHITVKDKQVIDFKTYMTGEFFQLLSRQSILSTSVQEESQHGNHDSITAFEAGVMQSRQDNLLHSTFLVRTNQLFGHFTKELNYHYLSGLLIGSELKEWADLKTPITIVGNEVMRKYYKAAVLRLNHQHVDTIDADDALVKGHCKMVQLL